jgi:hypothetical protein
VCDKATNVRVTLTHNPSLALTLALALALALALTLALTLALALRGPGC